MCQKHPVQWPARRQWPPVLLGGSPDQTRALVGDLDRSNGEASPGAGPVYAPAPGGPAIALALPPRATGEAGRSSIVRLQYNRFGQQAPCCRRAAMLRTSEQLRRCAPRGQAPFDHALSAQLDALILQVEQSQHPVRRFALRLRKRWDERRVPAEREQR